MPSERGEAGISSAIIAPILQVLAELGIDVRSDKGAHASSASLVAGAAADRLLDAAAKQLGDGALGITLARKIPIGGLGLIDYALCTSSTLGEALERVARHYDVATQRVSLRLHEAPTRATLIFERRVEVAHSRHWLEFSFAIIAERMRQTVGRKIVFEEICFRHPPPERVTAHDAFFGTKVAFGQAEDRLGFGRALLAVPLLTASSSLAALLDVKMRELAPVTESHDLLIARVRHALASLLDDRDPRLESLAARLGMKPRTLQRELGVRRTSHKELLDALRRQRALALLGESLSLAQIADRLAYSEPSAFFRAFRRWTGTSPRAHEGAARGRPARRGPS